MTLCTTITLQAFRQNFACRESDLPFFDVCFGVWAPFRHSFVDIWASRFSDVEKRYSYFLDNGYATKKVCLKKKYIYIIIFFTIKWGYVLYFININIHTFYKNNEFFF